LSGAVGPHPTSFWGEWCGRTAPYMLFSTAWSSPPTTWACCRWWTWCTRWGAGSWFQKQGNRNLI